MCYSGSGAELLWLRGLLSELGVPQEGPTTIWCDNSGTVAIANDAASVGRSRHIARRARFMLDITRQGAAQVQHIPTAVNAADLLSKPLDRARFVQLREHLMNTRAQVRASDGAGSGPGSTPDADQPSQREGVSNFVNYEKEIVQPSATLFVGKFKQPLPPKERHVARGDASLQ